MTEYQLTAIDRVQRVVLGWELGLHGGYMNLGSHLDGARGSTGDSVAGGSLSEDPGIEPLGSGTGSCSSESTGESEGWLLESVMLG